MSVLKFSQKYHKWLMLFLGSQFVIWSITGAYMVFLDIDYIHGDSLVINHQGKIDANNIQYTLTDLYLDYPNAKDIRIGKFINDDVYRFSVNKKKTMLDVNNGGKLSPLTQSKAVEVAQYYYSGKGKVAKVELISEAPPFELSHRHLPAWRIDFNDFAAPSFYISSHSGLLVTKRHQFWRLFDWMFRFHIMDYGDDEDSSNHLLFYFAIFGIFASITGLVLMYFKVVKVQRKRFTK